MARSIIQSEKECFVCKTTLNLHEHHVFFGTGNRKISEKYGMKVWLCQEHHTGRNGVHFDRQLDLLIKTVAQGTFEKEIGSREEFRRLFGRSYL